MIAGEEARRDASARGRALALLIVAGIVARLVLAPLIVLTVRGDGIYYLAMAQNIRDHGVFGIGTEPGFLRPPLYADFLAGLLSFGGDIKLVAALAQGALTIVSALALYLALVRTHPRVALLGGFAVAVSPFGILNDAYMLQESLYTSVAVVAVALAYRLTTRASLSLSLLVGVLCGGLTLVRDAYLLFPLCLIAFLLFAAGRPALKGAAILLIAYALTLSPWIARNASLPSGGFFLSKGILGTNLWLGTWLTQRSDLVNDHWGQGEDIPERAFADDAERTRVVAALRAGDDAGLQRLAVARIRAAPLRTLGVWIRRAPTMWLGTRILPTLSIEGFWATILKAALYLLDCAVILLGVIGMALVTWRRDALVVLAAPVAYVLAIYVPLYNCETRYSAAALPFLYVFAVVALLGMRDWASRSRRARRIVESGLS